jgi:hypothetical protein
LCEKGWANQPDVVIKLPNHRVEGSTVHNPMQAAGCGNIEGECRPCERTELGNPLVVEVVGNPPAGEVRRRGGIEGEREEEGESGVVRPKGVVKGDKAGGWEGGDLEEGWVANHQVDQGGLVRPSSSSDGPFWNQGEQSLGLHPIFKGWGPQQWMEVTWWPEWGVRVEVPAKEEALIGQEMEWEEGLKEGVLPIINVMIEVEECDGREGGPGGHSDGDRVICLEEGGRHDWHDCCHLLPYIGGYTGIEGRVWVDGGEEEVPELYIVLKVHWTSDMHPIRSLRISRPVPYELPQHFTDDVTMSCTSS